MGTLHAFYHTMFLVVVMSMISATVCLDSYYKMSPAIVEKNHIEVMAAPDGTGQSIGGHGPAFNEKGTDVSKSMIVNGWEVETSKFPFMVSIQILEQKYKRYHICGAVLITTNKALTAAHCMDYWGGVEHFAAVGFTRLSQHGQALVRIIDAEIHPKYKADEEGYPNDMAVITFEEHVELSDRVQLANLSMPGDPTYENRFCYVMGWGMTEDYYSYPDELRFAALLSVGRQDCKKFFKVFETKKLVRSHHWCGWYWPYSACYGDSGGPLVCEDQVVGITSWAADCTGCFPVVFARVASFWDWIEPQMM